MGTRVRGGSWKLRFLPWLRAVVPFGQLPDESRTDTGFRTLLMFRSPRA